MAGPGEEGGGEMLRLLRPTSVGLAGVLEYSTVRAARITVP